MSANDDDLAWNRLVAWLIAKGMDAQILVRSKWIPGQQFLRRKIKSFHNSQGLEGVFSRLQMFLYVRNLVASVSHHGLASRILLYLTYPSPPTLTAKR